MSESSTAPAKKPLLSDKLYDSLKKFVTLVLPAVGTLYFALAQIWGLPKAEEVIGSIAALATAMGSLLHISSVTYNNSDTIGGKYVGDLVVEPHPQDPSTKILAVHLNEDAASVIARDEAVFKVQPPQPE